ncbi:hypothetical protein PGB90_008668 [Kerria lacca]
MVKVSFDGSSKPPLFDIFTYFDTSRDSFLLIVQPPILRPPWHTPPRGDGWADSAKSLAKWCQGDGSIGLARMRTPVSRGSLRTLESTEIFGIGLILSSPTNFIAHDFVGDFIDLDLAVWLLAPLIISFLLPSLIVLLLYMTSIILYIYKWHKDTIREAYESHLWDGARKFVAALWDAHGWIWHGYEIEGLDKIPDDTPALFVYYHGAIPVDLYYFLSRVFLLKNRLIHTVADRFLFKIPGFSIISEALKVIPGTVQTCSTILKENNLLAIAPGGVYEAQFGDCYYSLMWKKRLGFAKVAIDAKVPIIPIFTENIREAFRSITIGRRLLLKLYLKTRFPFVPIYGGFPVKLLTHVGEPIPYDQDLSPEDLQIKVAEALEKLILKHQKIPGSIMKALFQRIQINKKKKD